MIIICMPCFYAEQAEIRQKQVLQDLMQHTRSKIHLLTNQTAVEGLHTECDRSRFMERCDGDYRL